MTGHPSDRLFHNTVEDGKEAMEMLVGACHVEITGFEQMIAAEQADPMQDSPAESARYISDMERGIAELRTCETVATLALVHWVEVAKTTDDPEDIASQTAARLRDDDNTLISDQESQNWVSLIVEALESGDYSGLAF